jgi:hypothetical protein
MALGGTSILREDRLEFERSFLLTPDGALIQWHRSGPLTEKMNETILTRRGADIALGSLEGRLLSG